MSGRVVHIQSDDNVEAELVNGIDDQPIPDATVEFRIKTAKTSAWGDDDIDYGANTWPENMPYFAGEQLYRGRVQPTAVLVDEQDYWLHMWARGGSLDRELLVVTKIQAQYNAG